MVGYLIETHEVQYVQSTALHLQQVTGVVTVKWSVSFRRIGEAIETVCRRQNTTNNAGPAVTVCRLQPFC